VGVDGAGLVWHSGSPRLFRAASLKAAVRLRGMCARSSSSTCFEFLGQFLLLVRSLHYPTGNEGGLSPVRMLRRSTEGCVREAVIGTRVNSRSPGLPRGRPMLSIAARGGAKVLSVLSLRSRPDRTRAALRHSSRDLHDSNPHDTCSTQSSSIRPVWVLAEVLAAICCSP